MPVVLFGALLTSGTANAQSAIDLKINEVLVYNDSNYVDEYGTHSAWIEIFNSAYSTVDMGGLYLTNDLSNPTMYKIPKGNPGTAISSRGFLVFRADGQDARGILHLNFKLEESKVVALFDSNGETMIDVLTLPTNAKRDVTFGCKTDGDGTRDYLAKSTPNNSNVTNEVVSGADTFAKMDPWGVAMIVIAMGVVFLALALLYFFFKNMGKFLNRDGKEKAIPSGVKNVKTLSSAEGETNAAIALALFLYRDQMHDQENVVLTINKVARAYSPWSSKIYGLRRWPRA